jgi:predicted metal-dependent phosphotriesterase family hydrolase
MPFLRTVTGDIPAAQAGVCYAHEHLIIDPSFTTFCNPDFLLDSVALAVSDIRDFRDAGGTTLVDSMPCGGGRNPVKLAILARATGTCIVCPTGLHLAKYYPPGHWGEFLSAKELAELFIADIRIGIDSRDYNGPSIDRTPHKAGVIKVATSGERANDRERRILEAAVIAHKTTGAPILTHTEQGAGALDQVRILSELGASLGKVVISHTDRRPDFAYHREILSTGVMLEYDSAFRWPTGENNPTLDLVVEMVSSGFGRQIVLGMDAARRKYWKAYGGAPGMAFLLREFVPRLRNAGLDEAAVRAIFVENPGNCYSFLCPEAA